MTAPLSLFLKTHYRLLWWMIFLSSLLPLIFLTLRYINHTLGINPLQALEQETGKWALVFLTISLAVTPLRRFMALTCQQIEARYGKRISDWNWIIRLRRMIGLYSLFYASLHLFVWLHFDLTWDIRWLLEEATEKPYLAVGFFAFCILVILGFTSPKFMMKKLGKNWLRIHRSIYLASILVVIHYWLSTKPGNMEPIPFTVIILFLLVFRLFVWAGILSRKPGDDGMPVPER